MTKGQRTIVALLAAVTVLLGLNLFSGTPEVKAQAGGPVRLVAGVVTTASFANKEGDRIYRFWSDGTVDTTTRLWVFGSCELQPVGQCGPVTIIP